VGYFFHHVVRKNICEGLWCGKILERDAKIAMAVQLYRDEKLTLKQASDLADLCLEDFMKFLSEKKVSLINWNEEELQKELKNANSF